MEPNKENIENLKSSTRIPVPLDPLPPLPRHLLKVNKTASEVPRQPLMMISNENVPGPSHGNVSHKKKRTVILDARHVTVRPKKENLETKYKIFNDDPTASDDFTAKEFCYFDENTQKNDTTVAQVSITPLVKSPILELNRVKNIKQSLKRPHSRELQGISPVTVPHKLRQGNVARQLPFNSRLEEKLEPFDFSSKLCGQNLAEDYTTDIFNYLIEIEKKPLDIPKTPSVTRACIVNWIMKVNGADGNPAVVQTACWFLDSILGTMHVQLDKLQLVAAACYWIAQKINGPVYTAKRLVKFANQAFSPQKLLAAEKLVLQKLEFPTQPVVPQDFINYLAWCCDNEYPSEIEIAATFLCMSALMVDKSLCNEYPSVVAAASVYNALMLLRKHDLLKRLQVVPQYMAAQTKGGDITHVNAVLRKAVRMIASPYYEYKAPFDHYGLPPVYIAQRIADAANKCACSQD